MYLDTQDTSGLETRMQFLSERKWGMKKGGRVWTDPPAIAIVGDRQRLLTNEGVTHQGVEEIASNSFGALRVWMDTVVR